MSRSELLTQEQWDHWETEGYLVMPAVFDESEVQCMQQEADFILSLIINSSYCHDRHSRRLDIRRSKTGGMVVRKIQPIIDLSLPLSKFSRDQRLIGPMAEFMGEEPVLMEEKLNYKQPVPEMSLFSVPADDDRFPVHNDWAYYLMNGYPDTIISSAMTLDNCGTHNGTLRVYPRSHRQHIEHERVRNGLQIKPGTWDFDAWVPIEAPAGSVVFFHSRLVHSSSPNRSGAPRRVMIYSHYPKSADMGIDIRNGPNRLNESPWEWEYRRRKDVGLFEDIFVAQT